MLSLFQVAEIETDPKKRFGLQWLITDFFSGFRDLFGNLKAVLVFPSITQRLGNSQPFADCFNPHPGCLVFWFMDSSVLLAKRRKIGTGGKYLSGGAHLVGLPEV